MDQAKTNTACCLLPKFVHRCLSSVYLAIRHNINEMNIKLKLTENWMSRPEELWSWLLQLTKLCSAVTPSLHLRTWKKFWFEIELRTGTGIWMVCLCYIHLFVIKIRHVPLKNNFLNTSDIHEFTCTSVTSIIIWYMRGKNAQTLTRTSLTVIC